MSEQIDVRRADVASKLHRIKMRGEGGEIHRQFVQRIMRGQGSRCVIFVGEVEQT